MTPPPAQARRVLAGLLARTFEPRHSSGDRALPLRVRSAPLLVVGAAVSIQSGAALATKLFESIGPLGAVWLRSGFATLMLLPIAWRALRRLDRRAWADLLLLGLALAGLNASFYEAIARLPLGVAVAIEFIGPLAVALIGSHGRVELAAAALAGFGVALLGHPQGALNAAGVAFALGAAAFWGAYILLAKRTLSRMPTLPAVAGALLIGLFVLAPAAIMSAGSSLAQPRSVGLGISVAALSSALPLLLELAALGLVTAAVFSVLLSLEPAVAALVAFLLLGQRLRAVELLAIACVVTGSAIMGRRAKASAVA